MLVIIITDLVIEAQIDWRDVERPPSWMNSLIGIKNQLVHKGIQHLHVSKQATKISEIRLHHLGYKVIMTRMLHFLVLIFW